MNCALCLGGENLCNSHIVPEFLYKEIYGADHRAVIVKEGQDYMGTLQKGYREKLLCSKCETHLNKNFEQKFKFIYESDIWANAKPHLVIPEIETRRVENLDYTVTKLFFLSILWRMAAVRNPKGFNRVDLGPHYEILRKAILDLNSMDERMYPIRLMRMRLAGSDAPVISGVTWVRQGPFRCYRFLIPNYLVMIDIASESVMLSAVNSLNLKLNGTIEIPAVDYRNLAEFNGTVKRIHEIDQRNTNH
jgi:hypothetical protein